MIQPIHRSSRGSATAALAGAGALVAGLIGGLAYDSGLSERQQSAPTLTSPPPERTVALCEPAQEQKQAPSTAPLPESPPTPPPVSPARDDAADRRQVARLVQQVADLQLRVESQDELVLRAGDLVRDLKEQLANDEEQLRVLRAQQESSLAREEDGRQRVTWYGQAGAALDQASEILMTGTQDVASLLASARRFLESAATSGTTAQGDTVEATSVERALGDLSAAEDSIANSDLASARVAVMAATQSVVAARATLRGTTEATYAP